MNQLQDISKTNSSQRSLLSISSHDSNKDVVVHENRPNHRKKMAPKPPTQQPKSVDESALNNVVESTTNLEIRGPSELLLGFPHGLRTQWRHSAEVLVTGAVKYDVNVRRIFKSEKKKIEMIFFYVQFSTLDQR